MNSKLFTANFERFLGYHLQKHGFEKYQSSYIYRSGTGELALTRIWGRGSGPGFTSLVLTFRHRFLRDLHGKPSLHPVIEPFACPFKFSPLELYDINRPGWHYSPSNLRYEDLMISYGDFESPWSWTTREIPEYLDELARLLIEVGKPWSEAMTPRTVRDQIIEYGEDAYVERIWLEDYDKALGESGSRCRYQRPIPGTVEAAFESLPIDWDASWCRLGHLEPFVERMKPLEDVREETVRRCEQLPTPLKSLAYFGAALSGQISVEEIPQKTITAIATVVVEFHGIRGSWQTLSGAELWGQPAWGLALLEQSRKVESLVLDAVEGLLPVLSPEEYPEVLSKLEYAGLLDTTKAIYRLASPGLCEQAFRAQPPDAWAEGMKAALMAYAARRTAAGLTLEEWLEPFLLSALLSLYPSELGAQAFRALPLQRREAALLGEFDLSQPYVETCPTPTIVDAIIARIVSSNSTKTQEYGEAVLKSFGEAAAAEVLRVFESSRGKPRSTFAAVLSASANPNLLDVYLAMLTDKSAPVRRAGIEALASLGSIKLPHLPPLLNDKRKSLRDTAITLLERLHSCAETRKLAATHCRTEKDPKLKRRLAKLADKPGSNEGKTL